jgi:hypothetical protein
LAGEKYQFTNILVTWPGVEGKKESMQMLVVILLTSLDNSIGLLQSTRWAREVCFQEEQYGFVTANG